MINLFVETRRLRPLPRTVPPFHNETIRSYLSRLAAANRLDPEALRIYAAGDRHRSAAIPADRISILSSRSIRSLRHAIPDLCSTDERDRMHVRARPGLRKLIRTACGGCTAGRGVNGIVECHLQQEDVVCLRHQRWIGEHGSTASQRQPSLTRQPEILAANRLHRRIIHRYGRFLVEAAYHEAQWVGGQWRKERQHTQTFQRLMGVFHPGHWEIAETDATVEAATYPQIIALTRLLAAPEWRALPFGSAADIQIFTAETQRTAAPDFRWNTTRSQGHWEPLVELFVEEAEHRNGQRPHSYRAQVFTLPHAKYQQPQQHSASHDTDAPGMAASG